MTRKNARILWGALWGFTLLSIAYVAYAWRSFYRHPELSCDVKLTKPQRRLIEDYFARNGGFPCEPFEKDAAIEYLTDPWSVRVSPACLAFHQDANGRWIGVAKWFGREWDFRWDNDGNLQEPKL